jgi:hypothetical protein
MTNSTGSSILAKERKESVLDVTFAKAVMTTGFTSRQGSALGGSAIIV